MHNLRTRFILSHILPTLIIIPLMGFALIYLLETQVLLGNLSSEVNGQAILITDMASQNRGLWVDRAQAKGFADRVGKIVKARVMILDSNGTVLASSDAASSIQDGDLRDSNGFNEAREGQFFTHTTYNQDLKTDIVDVFAPVISSAGQVVGIIRLTYQLEAVIDQFIRLRYLIGIVLAGGLVLGASLGWMLALDMEKPLRRVTETVSRVARGVPLDPVPETGPVEIRQLSHSVNMLVERLQTLETSRKQLLANLVHEIGRPLGALRSAIQALLGGAQQDPKLRQELLVGIDNEIGILQRLLDDLSGLYGKLLGPLEVDQQPIILSNWIPEAIATWREAALNKKIKWEVSIPNDLPVIQADPSRLSQALGNLLSNAVKYTPSGGEIFVAAGIGTINITNEPDGPRKPHAWIQVADTGPGIQTSQLEEIFKPFYRGNLSGRFPQGMGLGLTIARDLVAANGGKITVESVPGKGSKFTIWLPVNTGRIQ
ncbi:MAG: sensor histidine kinase [Omnitrophica WOR_2 bacterium]